MPRDELPLPPPRYEVGEVSSKQLERTHRFDAAYNIAFKHYEPAMSHLLETSSKEQLRRIAESVPLIPHAAAIVREGARRHFEQWTYEELALYLLQIQDEGTLQNIADVLLERTQRSHQTTIEAVPTLKAALAKMAVPERPDPPKPSKPETDLGEWKEDACEICGAHIGAGYEAFHLGRCDDHPREEEESDAGPG